MEIDVNKIPTFWELDPQKVDYVYLERVLDYIFKPKEKTVEDISKFNNRLLFIEYVCYYYDMYLHFKKLLGEKCTLPNVGFNDTYTKIIIQPYEEPKIPICRY